MKLRDLWKAKDVTLSFEAFPPKKGSDFDSVRFAVEQIAELKPDSAAKRAAGGFCALESYGMGMVRSPMVTLSMVSRGRTSLKRIVMLYCPGVAASPLLPPN